MYGIVVVFLALYLPIYIKNAPVYPQVSYGQQSSMCLTCLVYVTHLKSYVVNFTVNNLHSVDTVHFIPSILRNLRCSFYISHPIQ